MTDRFSGKSAIVTGGAGGIGSATARRLAREGANVAIVDLNGEAASALAKELGSGVIAIQADLSAEDSVEKYMNEAIARFGQIDLVFNNAAMLTPPQPFIDQDTDYFSRQWLVNGRAVFIATRDALSYFKTENRRGAIVNTSALAGISGARNLAAYCSSKHAVVGMSKVAAAEGAKFNVRVNVVCPGFIETDTIIKSLPTGALQQIVTMMPMDRGGQPEEVAALVCWLLSDEASYVSGAIIPVDGALSAVFA